MRQVSYTTEPGDHGKRLDQYLVTAMEDLTRSAVQRLCDQGQVVCGGKPLAKNYKLRGGEIIHVTLPAVISSEVRPQKIAVPIVYEDDYLLVVDKPKGMVVHPAPGNEENTLVNALLYHCKGSLSGIGGVARPGIVHRIDKDTSGLLVVAKNDQAHLGLSEQVKAHSFSRIYHAIVYGTVKQDSGTVNAPIGRHPTERKKLCVTDRNAREAVTHFQVIARLNGFSHMQLRLETGRTHQIRVHMRHIGHPVAGDPVYGPKKVIASLGGQCLHAQTLGFVHPVSGNYLEFKSTLPDYFTVFLEKVSST